MTWKYHPIQLDKLQKIAEAATPGPWTEDDGNVFEDRFDEIAESDDMSGHDIFICTTEQRSDNFDADAAFIAAFNPQTVLRLIAWIRSLERNEYKR